MPRNAERLGLVGPVQSVLIHDAYLTVEAGEVREYKRFPVSLMTFEATGNLREDRHFKENGSVDYRRVYVHGADGTLKEATVYNNDGRQRSRERFSYDAVKKLCVVDYSKQSNKRFVRTDGYLYDKHGRTVEGYKYARDGSVGFKTVYRYDEVGRLLEEQEYSVGRNYVLTTRRLVFEYDSKGWLVRERHYDRTEREPVYDFIYDFVLDSKGNWVKRTQSWLVEKNGTRIYEPRVITYRNITYRE